jgi:hypothetical protein
MPPRCNGDWYTDGRASGRRRRDRPEFVECGGECGIVREFMEIVAGVALRDFVLLLAAVSLSRS